MDVSSSLLTASDTRKGLAEVLTRAEQGVPVGVRRRARAVAIVDVPHLLSVLWNSPLVPRPVAEAEAGGWSVFLPGAPVAADGNTFESAVEDFVDALREYAEDWSARLRTAPNHERNWALVQLVNYSTDDDLVAWIRGTSG